MIEKLKYALFSIPDYDIYRRYFQTNDSITIYRSNVIIKATNKEVSVYYDPDEPLIAKDLKYISKENTIKSFEDIPSAIDYMNYLSLVTSDIRYTSYHYFLYRLKEIKLNYEYFSFGLAGSYSDYSEQNLSIRCDVSELSINEKKVKYNFIVIFDKNYKCRLSFYPEKPVWNEGKNCPETEVDKVIDYIINLNVDNYEDIPLIES